MDGRTFDQFVAAMAKGRSRRRLLRLLGLGAAGLGMTWLGTEEVTARDDPRCRNQQTRGNSQCDAFACASGCRCTRTVSGKRACLDDFAAPDFCPARDECDRGRHCPQGYACAKVGGCCPEHPRRNLCLQKCPA